MQSGVPEGTVRGPLMFLLCINDISNNIHSPLHLFADDCLLYRVINTEQDALQLQQDLNTLSSWAENMANQHLYLGILLDKKLSWSPHTSRTTSKATRTLNFLKRNPSNCSTEVKAAAYVSMVHPTMEYAAAVWDPHYVGILKH